MAHPSRRRTPPPIAIEKQILNVLLQSEDAEPVFEVVDGFPESHKFPDAKSGGVFVTVAEKKEKRK